MMMKKIIILSTVLLAFASCTTMRYEILDDPEVIEATELSEKEVLARSALIDGSGRVETFSSQKIPEVLSPYTGQSFQIADGLLVFPKNMDKDGFLRVGTPGQTFQKITMCLRSDKGMYISCHTSADMERGTDDIEPTLFLSSERTHLVDYWQTGVDWDSREISSKDYAYVRQWVLVEVTRIDGRLEFKVNGRNMGSVDIKGRQFPGLWLHFQEGTERVEIDYLVYE